MTNGIKGKLCLAGSVASDIYPSLQSLSNKSNSSLLYMASFTDTLLFIYHQSLLFSSTYLLFSILRRKLFVRYIFIPHPIVWHRSIQACRSEFNSWV